MITTVTLNPCIDYTIRVPGVNLGELNLVASSRTDMAGKGLNVSIVLKELGVGTLCTGISFAGNHGLLRAHLDRLGVPHDFVVAPGDIRTNIKLMDTNSNTMTELNSRGNPVPGAVLDEAAAKIVGYAAKSDMLVMSGRIPNGAGEDIYRRLMQKLRGFPCRVVVDAERQPLAEAVKEKPYLIKPNLFELEHTFGRKAQTVPEILAVCGWIISSGVELVCVSMGERGALIASRDAAYQADALDIAPKGFPGAGDSMVAGICKAATEHLGLEAMLRYGVAAASASLILEGTQLCQRADFEEMAGRVAVRKL
jgi:1-phosphofructokinase